MNEDINVESIIEEWTKSKEFTDKYTTDFVELDTLADGIPLTHGKDSAYVGDTTIAGLVRSIPRSSMQQLPIFGVVVNGTKNSVTAQVATYLLRDRVFNEDTFGKGLLSTLQIGAEQALTHGYAPFMTAVGSMYNDFGTTMRLLHYEDIAPEPGIQDANESGYFYVRANLPKSNIEKILRRAQANENTSWDVIALQTLLENPPSQVDYAKYLPDSRNKSSTAQNSNTYEIITRYETGKGGRFVTFSPQVTERPLRVISNNSKWGYPRVQFLVIDPDALTPFGISRVRLASPNQNLMNSYYQNISSMFIINSKPPILKRGRFTKPVQLRQGAVWETLDQNAKAELVTLDNGALNSFVNIAQQMSSQIQNIMGAPAGTANGGTNTFGFSKTAPGVKMQQNYLDLSSSQLTNIMENFLRQYALVALDTYISEQSGDVKIIVDDEAKNAINRIAPDSIGDDNTIGIIWEEFYDSIKKWKVEIELSMGKDELDEKQRGDLQDTLTVLAQNSENLGPEVQVKIKEITDMLLEKTVPQSKRMSITPPIAAPIPLPPTEAPTSL